MAPIPHTREVTTLGGVAEGDDVNLEVDVVAKYVGEARCAVRLEPLYRISFAYPEHYLSRGPDTLYSSSGKGGSRGR